MNDEERHLVQATQPLLLEEYKIIQGKIDKLGEDKFKVRSWCFTLLTGGVAIAKFSGVLEQSRFSASVFLVFLPAIAAFHLVEIRQRQLGKRLGMRAEAIERSWRKIYTTPGRQALTPQLAGYLIREGRAERALFSITAWKKIFDTEPEPEPNTAGNKRPFRAAPLPSQKGSFKGFLVTNADDAFYWFQYIVLLLLFTGILVYQNVTLNSVAKAQHPETNQTNSVSVPTNSGPAALKK